MSLLDQLADHAGGADALEDGDDAVIESALDQAVDGSPFGNWGPYALGAAGVALAILLWPAAEDARALRVGAAPSIPAMLAPKAVERPIEVPEPRVERPRAQPASNPEPAPSPTPAARKPTLNALLTRAQREKKERAFERAAKTYARAIALYPKQAAAVRARVALGDLQLRKLGAARDALQSYEGYLDGDDTLLIEEAAYGRTRALRKLGKSSAERAAVEAFLERFPASPYVEALKERRKSLVTPKLPSEHQPLDGGDVE